MHLQHNHVMLMRANLELYTLLPRRWFPSESELGGEVIADAVETWTSSVDSGEIYEWSSDIPTNSYIQASILTNRSWTPAWLWHSLRRVDSFHSI